MKTVGVYHKYDEFCSAMVKEFKNISKSTIAKEEEGAVFYFIKRDMREPHNHRDEVVSMTKLKTLEYRLFRKMREKLRNYVSGKGSGNPDVVIDKFVREAEDLTRGHQTPQRFNFYVDVLDAAFDLISQKNKQERKYMEDMLMNKYIDFMEEAVLEAGNKTNRLVKVDFNSSVLNRQEILDYVGPTRKPHPKSVAPSKEEQKKTTPSERRPRGRQQYQ